MKKLFLLSLLVFTCTMYSQETTLKGKVSYYADKFHGRKTASGKVFDNTKLTCAHKTLPFGTFLKIINPINGRFVIVEVIDRGPYIKNRIVDLSRSAFLKIGDLEKGVMTVIVEKITKKEAKLLAYEEKDLEIKKDIRILNQ
jgi:rare lipoprotein A